MENERVEPQSFASGKHDSGRHLHMVHTEPLKHSTNLRQHIQPLQISEQSVQISEQYGD
jgi:hypothetical protein